MTEEIRIDRETRPEPLSVIWRILAAPQTSLALAALVTVMMILACLIPQIPPYAMADPQAWLATQPGVLGRRGSLLATLGLYSLAHGLWLRLLVAISTPVLVVRLVESAELAWRGQQRSTRPVAAILALEDRGSRVQVLSSGVLEDVQGQVGRFLDRNGYRTVVPAESPAARWLGSRRPALLWLHPLGYAALLLSGAGLILSSYWGWQDEDWRPMPGETRVVGHSTPYALRLDGFDMQLDQEGRLETYASRVTWLQGPTMAQEAVVSTGRPVQYQGLSLHQIGYLPRVQLQAWDRDGNPLALESGGEAQPGAARVEIRFLEDDEQPLVYMPAQERFLVLVFEPMCQQGQPALHVDWMDEDGGGRQRLVSLTSSGEVLAHDLRLRVELSYGPTLRLSRRPGMGLVPSGLSLAALVLLVGWLAPSQLISVMAEPQRGGGTCVQIAAPRGPRAPQWLQKLAVRLEEALGDDG